MNETSFKGKLSIYQFRRFEALRLRVTFLVFRFCFRRAPVTLRTFTGRTAIRFLLSLGLVCFLRPFANIGYFKIEPSMNGPLAIALLSRKLTVHTVHTDLRSTAIY